MKIAFFFAVLSPVAFADVSQCVGDAPGTTVPCAPGHQTCPPGNFGAGTPQFHVKDASCGENDPNGPSYDPVHGVYHLHYQNHVGLHGGRTYGHAVSKDLIHWAHMPISIWNDQFYDTNAIYTGSATIVDGKVVQVYPGLCSTGKDGCPGGTNLCIAKPDDETDQLQTNWTKDAKRTGAVNPIRNNTGRDPSTAWKTPAGEWRLTTFDTIIYGSMDFNTWYTIGKQPGFPGGECPSFFPLPRTTPGAGAAPAGAKTYTHVHKASHGGDWMQVGTYVANGVKENGNWTGEPEVKIDQGNFYASKDFFDPVGNNGQGRRINWGWATVPPASTQTMPREVTWNPELQQLVFSPLPEQDELRGAVLADVTDSKPIAAGDVVTLMPKADAGNCSEVEVKFEIPSAAARVGVVVMAGDDPSSSGTLFYIDYEPPTVDSSDVHTVQVGAMKMVPPTPAPAPTPPTPSPYKRLMQDVDLTGQDYSVQPVTYSDPAICQKACDDDDKCDSWTLVPKQKCCLKKGYPAIRPTTGMVSGVKDPSKAPVGPAPAPAPPAAKTDTLKLSPNDKSLTIRVYVDNTFSEAYWMGGRVAMTLTTPDEGGAIAAVAQNGGATLSAAKAYAVNSIWISEAEVRAAPRKDGKPIRGW
eukprot:g747.t1